MQGLKEGKAEQKRRRGAECAEGDGLCINGKVESGRIPTRPEDGTGSGVVERGAECRSEWMGWVGLVGCRKVSVCSIEVGR